jgi:hypothetical protein
MGDRPFRFGVRTSDAETGDERSLARLTGT